MNRESPSADSLALAVAFTALLVAGCLAATSAHAGNAQIISGRAFAKTSAQKPVPPASKDEPVLLEANDIHYDHENDVVTASGKVEVVQGETVLIADELIYDQQKNTVYARGNTSILEPSGNVVFADQIDLADDMKQGIIRHFSARLADGSLFAAASAHKIDENTFDLTKAVYSACNVKCHADGSSASPMWQIKTDHVRLDQLEHRAVYGDTYFETYGIPVFYTPYFSHSLPGAENESGFLIPQYQYSNNVGTMVHVPYYYAIAKDKDATVTPIFTSNDGLVMAGEYRQLFDSGQILIDGSATNPSQRNSLGAPAAGREIRGNINAWGDFNVGEYSGWGFDIHRVTDDTYLRRYDFAGDTLLTSQLRGYTSHFSEPGSRSFARMQALAFQGLTAQDNRRTIPFALPLADVNYESTPDDYGSRFLYDGNFLLLHRDLGADSRRFSNRIGWKLPYISDDGQVIEFATHLRADVYEVSDVRLADGRYFDGTTGRMIPDASVMWRYPFISRIGEDSSLMIEPVIQLVASPGGGNTEKIPNEDSLVPEFTDSNLFSDDRYPGLDRVETGPRASYGLRGQAQVFSDSFIDWLIGQHYRMNDDRTFPYSNDLQSNFSDYIGKVGLSYQPFGVAYRFRLDKDSLAPKRSEFDGGFSYKGLNLNASYLSLRNDPVLATKEAISGSASLKLSDYWTLSTGAQRDLEQDFTNSTYTGLAFQNECTSISTVVGRSYTRDRDIEPSTNILFIVSLKNLE